MKIAICPGAKLVVVVSVHALPGGGLTLWQVGVTPPAGLTGLSVTPTSVRSSFPVLVTVKV